MSTSPEFMEYVCDQLREAGEITYKKMFGEYGVYCRGKFYALVCDNQFYVKPTEAGAAVLGTPELAPPYDGAKDYFLIEDLENRRLLTELTLKTCEALPAPAPKKPKTKRNAEEKPKKRAAEEEPRAAAAGAAKTGAEPGKKIDYKKEYKDLYTPGKKPAIIQVPEMTFIMVNGKGNPNEAEGEYQQAVGLLYALSYAIKMSPKSGRSPEGYFDYVVPPLEGLWWLENEQAPDFLNKEKFCWTAMIRQPEFVTEEVFQWAVSQVRQKKSELDPSTARLERFEEGLCVQCMHIGSYDDEPATLERIKEFIEDQGLQDDISQVRRHHELYLGDPRKVSAEKRKTVLRIPVKKK